VGDVVNVRALVTGAVDVVEPGDPPALLQVVAGREYALPVEWFPHDPDGEPIVPAGLEVV
jgi:hypothetical protein